MKSLFNAVKHVTCFIFLFTVLTITKARSQTIHEANNHIMITPGSIKWIQGPASLPKGAQMMKLESDPKDSGLFTIRLKLPAGYKIMPHYHTAAEHVTVISGVFNMGTGDEFNQSSATKLPPTSFVIMQAGTRHYGFTNEGCIIQVHGIGPWKVIYVNALDDPRNHSQ